MLVAQAAGVRRAKQAAMLLTMAIGLGWSGPAADAQASRAELEVVTAMSASVDAEVSPVVEPGGVPFDDAQWRYVSARR